MNECGSWDWDCNGIVTRASHCISTKGVGFKGEAEFKGTCERGCGGYAYARDAECEEISCGERSYWLTYQGYSSGCGYNGTTWGSCFPVRWHNLCTGTHYGVYNVMRVPGDACYCR